MLSGGGTAGHVYPALAVAGALRSDGHDVSFVGTPEGTEVELATDAGLTYHAIPARGFDRGAPLTIVPTAATLAASTSRARGLLARERPDVVVGFGGYVSLAVGTAAATRRIPLVLHEQNAVPGLANRVLSRWASAVAVTHATSVQSLRHPDRAHLTGNPVRPGFEDVEKDRGREALGLEGPGPVLLAFGGSRGARHINEAMVGLYPLLASVDGLRVVHVAGRIEAASVRERLHELAPDAGDWYRIVEYLDDMGSALAASDLVVSRAGATSIAEITVVGRPAVLVPYPYATDDHQRLNAESVEAAGGATVIADAELDTDRFGEIVLSLLQDPEGRDRMARSAARLGRASAALDVARLVEAAGRDDDSESG